MASATRELQYRKYRNLDVVGGSSAYELDWADRERQLRHAGEAQRYQEQPKRREKAKVHAAPRVQVREAQHVSMVSVLGISAVLLLSLMVLGSYINLTMISAETVHLQDKLEALETENVALTAEYQQMFDLTTVKGVARAAGMDKPSSSQVCYIDMTGGDSAIIYQQEEPGIVARALDAVRAYADTMLEYFR